MKKVDNWERGRMEEENGSRYKGFERKRERENLGQRKRSKEGR